MQLSVACAKLQTGFVLTVKIRTAALQKPVLFGKRPDLSLLRSAIRTVVRLYPHKSCRLQPFHKQLQLLASKPVKHRMRQNRNASRLPCHVDNLLGRNFLTMHKIRRMVAQIPLKRLVPAFHIPLLQKKRRIMRSCDNSIRIRAKKRLVRYVNARTLKICTKLMVSVRTRLQKTRKVRKKRGRLMVDKKPHDMNVAPVVLRRILNPRYNFNRLSLCIFHNFVNTLYRIMVRKRNRL